MTDVEHIAADPDGVISFDRPVADFGDRLRALVERLFGMSDAHSYVSFAGADPSDIGIILLCGVQERFRTLRVLEQVRVPCLVVQDPKAPWFTGSETCPGLDHVQATARARFPHVRRWLLMGQSSGGYAALWLSRKLPGSLVLALAPQTFDDGLFKGKSILFPPGFHVSRTPRAQHIDDLRALFFGTPDVHSTSFIVSSYSEHENPPARWLWMDAMHWGRLADHPDVFVLVADSGAHPVLRGRVTTYSKLLKRLVEDKPWDRTRLLALIRHHVHGPAKAVPAAATHPPPGEP